jgi:hypothetical protein
MMLRSVEHEMVRPPMYFRSCEILISEISSGTDQSSLQMKSGLGCERLCQFTL